MSSEFEKIRRSCLKSGQLFEDPDFPCIQSSVFYHETPPFNFTWMRPHEICRDPEFLQIPDAVHDIKSTASVSSSNSHPNFESILGKLGDPWFISSISSLFQTKGLFYRVVPADQSFHEMEYAGIFRFRIWWFGQWQEVIIDDRLPIIPSHNNKLAFVQAIGNNVFWPCLLEKAFAKLHGSYEALKYGSSLESLSDLTGGVTELIDLKSDPMSVINTRILMQRLLSITAIVTAVISIDEINSAHLFVDHDHECSNSIRQQQHHNHHRNNRHQEQFMFGDDVHDAEESHRHHHHHREKRQSGYPQHHRPDCKERKSSRNRTSSSMSSSSSDHSPVHSLLHHNLHHHHTDPSFTSSSSSSNMPSIVPFPRLPCGIIGNVNYRITRIERVETVIGENREQIFLLKIINSTGSKRCNYSGSFGHKDDDAWTSISECDKIRIKAIDEEDEDDGNGDVVYDGDLYPRGKRGNSFWIEYTDFMRIFTHLEVVYLDAETSRDEPSLRNGCGSSRFPMIVKLYRGSWRKGVTAGGCRNNTDSFHQNPQIELTLSLESDDMMIICLNQHSVLEPQVVGFSIYNTGNSGNIQTVTSSSSCSSSSSSPPLSSSSCTHTSDKVHHHKSQKMDRSFFKKNKSLMNSSYSNSRQVLLRCSLDRGSYILIPTTFEPGIESGFTIRVYSMKGIKLRLLDHENHMGKTASLSRTPVSGSDKFSEYEIMFMQIADEHKTISAHDLHELLDSCLPNDYVKSCANIDVARLMISAADQQNQLQSQYHHPMSQVTGRLSFKDYKILMCSLRYFQSVFKNHTKGTTGIMRIEKLEDALQEIGFTLSTEVMMALVTKFMRKDSTLRFGDFVAIILHLSICFNSFTRMHQRQQHQRKIAAKINQTAITPITNLITTDQQGIDMGMGPLSTVPLSLADWLKHSFMT